MDLARDIARWTTGLFGQADVESDGRGVSDDAAGAGLVFVGDSLTEWGDWPAAFPGVRLRNMGVAGEGTEALLARRDRIVAARPDRILLMTGTNDIGADADPDAVAANVDALLAAWTAALPETRIGVQSVLPREPRFDVAVRRVNGLLEAATRARRLDWLDVYPALLTRRAGLHGDRLDPSVTEDGLHLNAEGYRRWAAAIAPWVRGDAAADDVAAA